MVSPGLGFAGAVIFSVFGTFLVLRYGLVSSTIWYFTLLLLDTLPITLQVSAWYSPYGFLALLILAAIVLYAFYTSLGGRPIFGTPRLDE